MRLLFSLIYAVVLCAGARGQAREITVAADGSGQFTSVQKAVDSAPSHSRERSVIHIKPGIYRERVTVPPDKTFLTLHGDDAMTTVITFDMHPMPNPNGGRALITFDTPTVFIQANDFTAENITFENSAGRQGQALALTIMSDRGVFRYCRFLGFQDTLLAQAGRQYFDHCYIQGATDFIFGGSAAYFDQCEIHVTANGYVTAANTPKDQRYGYVFSHSKITGEPGALTYLGRPWRANAATVFLNTEMSANVRPAGWNNWNDPAKEKTARYAEYASTGPGGDLSGRMEWGKHLTAAEAATYSIENVLGGEDGWDPRKGTVRKEAKTAKEQRPALAPLASGDVLLAVAASEDSRFAVSTDGYKWTVTKAAAPIGAFVMRGPDRTFHAVWSSGTRGDKSLMHASSKDLMEWNSPQRIEVMAKQDALDVVSPRLYWDGTRFLITWGSTMAVNSIQSFQEEVDNNPRIFYAATRDFETFTEPALLFDPNYSVKDAVMLPMGAGFALLHNDNTTPVHALRVAPGSSATGPWGPSRDAFTEKFVEQPAAIRLGEEWWIYEANSKTGEMGLEKTRDFWTFTDAGAVTVDGGRRLTSVMEVPRAVVEGSAR